MKKTIKMYVKFKKIKDNVRVRKGAGLIWSGIGIFGTITGSIFGYRLIRDEIWKPKKLQHVNFDDDVIEEAVNIKKKALKKGIELDFDETLNELQKNKNIKKDD